MAKKEKFILLSLNEDESKKLAQVISNDTSRKILDHLADKEATESELSKELGVPISTIHYNLQALVKAKLIEADEYHYSKKGKEILHYKLANKYIIIAPKSTFGIKEKLKGILPVGILAIAASSVVYLLNQGNRLFGSDIMAADMTNQLMEAAPKAMRTDATPMLAEAAIEPIKESIWQTILQNPALWFLFGCVFTVILLILVQYIAYLKKKA